MRALLLSVAALTSCSFPPPADVPSDAADTDAPLADAADGTDAADGRPDAVPPDAMPPPPVATGQNADLVLGQPDLAQNSMNNGGLGGRSLWGPTDVWSDGVRLWVADDNNNRVMQWNALPQINFAIADLAMGQSGTSASGSTVAEYKVGGGFGPNQRLGGFTVGSNVLIASPGFNRVLIWTSIPPYSGTNANRVIGFPDFQNTNNGAATASNLNGCSHVWTDGTKVAVVDTDHNRVLLWNAFPTSNGVAASVVLGQDTFSGESGALSPNRMFKPMGVWFDGERVFVADAGNNRVMVWNGWPTQNGKVADYFIGQGNGLTNNANAGGTGPNQVGLNHPTAVLVGGGALFIADAGNNRVVVHYPVPTSSAEMADMVIGQTDFVTGTSASTAARMTYPMGLGAAGGYLFVADTGNNRVLRFTFRTQ